MAYSSVRVQFELGHEASLKNKRTQEGFTHDWEVFVRGSENTDIQHFVDKVVFHLHETFPKPTRGVKVPPYSIKECGYAGFVIPIDVYLKNKEEPKKITFQYDLQLQTSGPPISRVLREPRVFQNPSEDFRRKLIKGGGVGVDSPLEDGKLAIRKPTQSPKKLEDAKSSSVKKHKPDSFAELFGTPIRRVTPEPKKAAEAVKKLDVEKKKEKKVVVAKDDREFKDKAKEKEKLKEKTKRVPSPLAPPPPPPPKPLKDEVKKNDDLERKKDESFKADKDRKEKHRDKDVEKSHKEKKPKEPETPKKQYVPNMEKPAPIAEVVDSAKEKPEKEKHRHKHKKREKEKNRDKDKHKHKEKEDKEVREKEKTKRKLEEANGRLEKIRSPSPVREKRRGPLGTLFSELSDSASALSDDDDALTPVRVIPDPPPRPLPEIKFTPVSDVIPKSREKDLPNEKKVKLGKGEDSGSVKVKKEKSPKKRTSKNDPEIETKRPKLERERSESSERERELESIRQREEQERERREKEEENRRLREREEEIARKEREAVEAAHNSKTSKGRKRNRDKTAEELPKPEEPNRVELTKEYLAQLRDLQRRIMTLEDNSELQKVVKVIAESGQYEVTKKTFDFDLCALDQATVRRLQQFFASST